MRMQIRLQDGHTVEAVIMRHVQRETNAEAATKSPGYYAMYIPLAMS